MSKRRKSKLLMARAKRNQGNVSYEAASEMILAAAKQRAEQYEDFKAQNGKVKVIMKDGKLID